MDYRNQRILVIEDEPPIAEFLRRGLSIKGFDVVVAGDGESGVAMASASSPDLALVDMMLPGIDGLEVCRRLRGRSELSIIALTARDTVAARIDGLEAGADDYVIKPFAFGELVARIRAVLRRTASRNDDEVLHVGDLVIQPMSRRVFRGSRSLDLTAREFDLLEFLARNAGLVLTRDQIHERVWGYEWEANNDPIKVYISYLRSKLNANGERDLIRSVRGVGYSLRV